MSETPSDDVVLRKIGEIATVLANAEADDDEGSGDLPLGSQSSTELPVESQPSTEPTTVSIVTEPSELYRAFSCLVDCKSCDDISVQLSDCVGALAGERTSKNQGRVGPELKAKSLLGRWMVKKPPTKDVDSQMDGDIVIERGTIIMVPVKTGRGASASVLPYPFRVTAIYEKFYNKWWLAEVPRKVWKKEGKKYKLDIRMIKKDVMEQYSDVGLYGMGFTKKHVYKRIDDSEISMVVGKLSDI